MMKRFVSRSLLGAAFAVGTLCTAEANAAPRTHDGFHLNMNAGIGYVSASAEQAGFKENMSGVSFPTGILIGGSVIPGLVIGGNLFWHVTPSPSYSLNGNSQTLSDVSMWLVGIGPYVDFYPNPAEGLHFQGMVGWGALERTINGNSGGNDPTGLIMQIGAGYDFWVGDEWSIGPLARFAYAPFSINDVSVSTIAPSLVCSFTYH
jgi:outer membrane autotransporter protein